MGSEVVWTLLEVVPATILKKSQGFHSYFAASPDHDSLQPFRLALSTWFGGGRGALWEERRLSPDLEKHSLAPFMRTK
jgi:hypothetical protein